MALIDKASLLMVPSVYEDGTLYNVLPSGNKAPDETGNHNGYDQTRADFTFSRGSNLAATRVNANGLIEKGRENLLLVSNSFNSGVWLNDDTTETSGFEGYDGTNDAWKLVGNTNASRHHIVQSKSEGGVNCWSLYAKASGHNYVQFGSGSTTNQYVNFDLSDGSIGSVGSDFFSAKTEDIGNGWYRLSVVDKGSTNGFYISLVSSKTAGWLESWSMPNSTDGIFIQNAQLEKGLVASTYLDSGATTATAGVLENTPRIDYSSGAGALLLEPQRTNLLAQSEYIHGWLNAGGTSSQNSTESTSPEGKYNAAVLDASSVRYLTHSISSATHSYSVYAKAKSGSIIGLRIDTPTTKTTNFDLSNGTISATGSGHTPSIESVGNGWYRCSITFTDSIVNTVLQTTASGSVYLWGAQLESSASYPSSYVPTYGSAATRGADSCSVTGVSDVIGQTEGTMYAEVQVTRGGRLLLIGTTGNFIELVTTSGGVINAFVYNGTTQVNLNGTTTFATGDTIKVAFAYKANDFALYVNGTANGTDTSGAVPSSMAQIIVNDYLSPGYNTANGYKQAILFNERLSNTELAALTA